MMLEENIAKVQERLPRGELLAQLAEERNELAQAALKLRRADGLCANPTPVSREEAQYDLEEEIADVLVCLKALGMLGLVRFPTAEAFLGDWMEAKAKRWARRLADG